MLSKNSKQFLNQAYKMSLRSAITSAPRMGLFLRAQQPFQRTALLASQQVRGFAAALPDHIELEMPNLSPTMEKVS